MSEQLQPSKLGRFIGYELSPVAEFENGTCEPQLSMDAARALSDKTFWSLYGRLPEGGVDCIGDYCGYEHAAETYSRITGLSAPENPDGEQLVDLPAGY